MVFSLGMGPQMAAGPLKDNRSWEIAAGSAQVMGLVGSQSHSACWDGDGVGFIPFILRVHSGGIFLPPFTLEFQKGSLFLPPDTLGCIFLSPFIPGLRKGSIFLSQFILGFSFPHSLRESTRSLWGPQGVHFPPSIHSGGPQKVAYILPHSFRTFTPGFFPPGDRGGCFGGLAQRFLRAAPARYRQGLLRGGGGEERGSTGGARPGTCPGGGGELCYWSRRQPMSGGGCLLRRADKKHRVEPRRRAQRWERGWG